MPLYAFFPECTANRSVAYDLLGIYLKYPLYHTSYERQGIDQIPTIHMGVAASQMEKKGIKTDRGNINRQAEVSNNQLRQLKARIRKSKDWLYTQPLTNIPTMITIMNNIFIGKNTQNHFNTLRNLKARAKVLIFLQHNNITDMAHLVQKIESINNEYKDLAEKIKPIERRLDTLAHHIAQYENRKQYRAIYNDYVKLNPKKRDDFYAKHKTEIDTYKDAREYFKVVMNGRTDPVPIKDWQAEQKKLIIAKFALTENYYGLQDEVRSVELLRKSAENLMHEDRQQERQPTKTHDRGI